MEMTQEQLLYNKFVSIRIERDYWHARCKLAEKIIEYKGKDAPFQIDECREAISEYNNFIQENKQP